MRNVRLAQMLFVKIYVKLYICIFRVDFVDIECTSQKEKHRQIRLPMLITSYCFIVGLLGFHDIAHSDLSKLQ